MTNEQAKQILQLYRPGTADATDPAFAEALEACERDAELKQWFSNHCALYAAIRSKLKKIPVPEGLKEQIIAERQVHRTPVWQKAVLTAGAVAVAVMAVMFLNPYFGPSEPHDFAAYRSYMGSVAEKSYGMDTNSSDLDAIRTYLAGKKAIADYVLPEPLQKNAKALGCVATTWQGKPVTMVCFQTDRPVTDPTHHSDLWLFISGNTIAKDAPQAGTPKFEKSNDLITANWTVGNRTYVLATRGDPQFLSKYLPGNTVL
ncbi:MAG TPA: hypothetical protein VHC44_17005 [Verrucomicrobiae bacterium]|nr:hypothetical protein [Verrucomicrobiae bacterium]